MAIASIYWERKKEASHCDKLVLLIISLFIFLLFLEIYNLTIISIKISSTSMKLSVIKKKTNHV